MSHADNDPPMWFPGCKICVCEPLKIGTIMGKERFLLHHRIVKLCLVAPSQVSCVAGRFDQKASGTQQFSDKNINILIKV